MLISPAHFRHDISACHAPECHNAAELLELRRFGHLGQSIDANKRRRQETSLSTTGLNLRAPGGFSLVCRCLTTTTLSTSAFFRAFPARVYCSQHLSRTQKELTPCNLAYIVNMKPPSRIASAPIQLECGRSPRQVCERGTFDQYRPTVRCRTQA
jgi:hypothetical protein